MQIEINLRTTAIPELKAASPILSLRIRTPNEMETEQAKEWAIPLYPKTIMGVVDGSYHGYVTQVYDYLGREIYSIIRLVQDV